MSMKLANVEREYEKDSQLKREEVLMFMEWVKNQPHLPEIIELQAVLFLQSCYYNDEKAKKALEKYFTMRTTYPDLFRFKSFNDPLLLKAMDVAFISILPEKTPEGYTVMILRTIDLDPNNYDSVYHLIYFGMLVILHLHLDGCDNGLILLNDLKGLTFGHLTRINFSAMKHCSPFLQEAMPVRLVGIHYINVISFIDKIMAIMKPFMNAEVKNMLHFHTSSSETLYKYVPKDCLPDEYGGKGGNMSDLHTKSKEMLLSNQEFFNWHDLQVVDETKRENRKKKSSNKTSNIDTNFKKLEID